MQLKVLIKRKIKFFVIFVVSIIVTFIVASCTKEIKYSLISIPLGIPVEDADYEIYKSQLCVYYSEEELENGISRFKMDGAPETTLESIREQNNFDDSLIIHVFIYHTSSDVVRLKSVTQKENLITINIKEKSPSIGSVEDVVFTHYFIKVLSIDIDTGTKFLLKIN